jgi:chromosome segregation ATPase
MNTIVKDPRMMGADITKLENQLESIRGEVEKTTRSRDALLAEISRKSDDFTQMMAMRDAEIKKSRADMLIEREQLNGQKSEFNEILKQHQADKVHLEQDKKELEIQKLRHASTTQNVQEFITAVRRATGLLGI